MHHMAQQVNAKPLAPGFLEDVPSSWLIEWITSLSPKDKLVLFQTSKWLAKHVVASARHIKFHPAGFLRSIPAEELSKPRDIIPQLLMHAHHDATVKTWTRRSPLQAYATKIEKWVPELAIFKDDQGCAASQADLAMVWGTFANLGSLRFFGGAFEQDIEPLCQALHAGHLHRLQTLDLSELLLNPRLSTEALRKLACALQAGACLTTISTDSINLIREVHGYRSLQNVHIDHSYLSKDFIRQLCTHPTLQDVCLNGCTLERCTDWPECSWKSVTLTSCDMKVLASLPLAYIPKVVFNNARATKDEQDVEALTDALTNHSAKLTLQPSFCLFGVCEHTAQLVKHLSNHIELYIWDFVLGPTAMKELWKSLPACVTSVVFGVSDTGPIESLDWAYFWDSIPTTVTHVIVGDCCLMPVGVLTILVRTAPEHVQKLKICCGDKDVLAAWTAAGVHDVAPAHLALELT